MFCIIGAGLAGDTAAATLRAEGYGGRVILIGDEAVPPYDRPPLSKEALCDDVPEDRLFLRAESWYAEQDIELKLGRAVVEIDRAGCRLLFAGGETLAYEKLLIATGSRARSLPAPGPLPVFVVRTLDDARGLRAALRPGARVAIVGAGVIGLEVAASAARRGADVTVVDLADRVLARVAPPAVSAFMAGLHERNGVRLLLSAGSVVLTATGLTLAEGQAVAADLIVVGIGVIPNVELAERAGLPCRDGILVDAHARTGDPDIFAVGDAARYPDPFGEGDRRCENWKHAQAQAVVAARNMAGGDERYATASSMWTDQYEVKLQTVGRLSGGEIARGTFATDKFMILYRNADGTLAGALGVNSAKDMRFAQMLIEKRVAVDSDRLADPKQDLRKLG